MYGVWLIPAVLAPLVIRKPGAALFAEMVAAVVSALLGTVWSIDVLLSGSPQGAAAERIFVSPSIARTALVVLVLAAMASSGSLGARLGPYYVGSSRRSSRPVVVMLPRPPF